MLIEPATEPRTLPAAAVPRGAEVKLSGGRVVWVLGVHHSEPRVGYVRWVIGKREELVINAARAVEVVSLP